MKYCNTCIRFDIVNLLYYNYKIRYTEIQFVTFLGITGHDSRFVAKQFDKLKSRPWPDIFELYVEKSINQCEMKVENSLMYY